MIARIEDIVKRAGRHHLGKSRVMAAIAGRVSAIGAREQQAVVPVAELSAAEGRNASMHGMGGAEFLAILKQPQCRTARSALPIPSDEPGWQGQRVARAVGALCPFDCKFNRLKDCAGRQPRFCCNRPLRADGTLDTPLCLSEPTRGW